MAIQIFGLMMYEVLKLLVSPIFWLVAVVIGWQTNRMAKIKSHFFQLPKEKILQKTLLNILFGLLGGLCGSILLVVLGVSVSEIGVEYLWITALLLLLIAQRLMCFAYASGIIGLSELIFGWPSVNIPQLIALVAVLHLVEAILILLSGNLRAMPIYTMGRHNQLVGGFVMQNFWPLPLVALAIGIAPPMASIDSVIAMPNWWPLLPSQSLTGWTSVDVIYAMVPVLAALGYSDLALTVPPKAKVRQSAGWLLLYSTLLLLLAILAAKLPVLTILPVIFAPFGHEYLIRLGQKQELKGDYLFSAQKGAMILDTLKGYPADEAGIKSGDIITAINGEPVTSLEDFFHWQEKHLPLQQISLKRGDITETKSFATNKTELGIIMVPKSSGLHYLDFNNHHGSLLKQLLSQMKRRKNKAH